jgi:D-alanine-D-alanine ligase
VPLSGVYSFEARYNAGETTFFTPARISKDATAKAADAAIAAHNALGLRHLSRVDMIVDKAGTPWFLEANVLPGLTETSLLPQALEAAGHDLGLIYVALANAAVAESRS